MALTSAGCSTPGAPTPGPGATASAADPGVSTSAALETTARVQEAVRAGDPTAAARLAGSASAARRLRLMAANRSELDVRDVVIRYRSAGAGAGDWEVTWRTGRLPGTARVSVPVTFAADGGRVLVARLDDPPPSAWWLHERLDSTRGPGWQLVAASGGGRRTARAVGDALDRSHAAVGDVLGEAPGVLVELPPDEPTYAALLAARGDEYARLAAVTTTVDGSARPGAGLRIVVNPAQVPQMDRDGLAVVLAHEMVHVAVDDVLAPEPLWLSEGFADYVALRGLGLTGRTTSLAAQVRRHGVPEGLPGRRAFQGRGDALEATYESAWLAAAVLAARLGPRGLVELRSGVHGRGQVAEAIARAGWSRRVFMERWRHRLGRLAATAPVGS